MARTDTAARVVAASPARVYAALVDPDALAAWLPPEGMSGRFERFDARPGGSYRMVLRYADASVLAPFSYTQLVWVSFLGFLLFGEVPDVRTGADRVPGPGR